MAVFAGRGGRRIAFPGPDQRVWAVPVYELLPAGAVHLHLGSSPLVSMDEIVEFTPAWGVHLHSASSPTLVMVGAGTVAPAGAAHLHIATSPTLTRVFAVTPAGAAHAHAAASPAVAQPSGLGISSVDPRGDMVVLTEDFTAEALGAAFKVRRQGYSAAGVAQTWDETIYLHARRMRETTNVAGNCFARDMMLSSVIVAGDSFPDYPGLTNSSTRTPPKVEARWTTPGFRLIGNTARAAVSVNCAYVRDGNPAACVKFLWTDGVATVTKTVVDPVAVVGSVSGLAHHEWQSGDVDVSALVNGQVVLNVEVYSHFGHILRSADFAASITDFGPQYFRKHTAAAAAPVYAYVLVGASGGTASLTPATARAAPFPTLLAARTAARTLNNTTYGIDGVDGVIIRLRDTGVALDLSVSSGDTVAIYAGPIIEPDPDDAWTVLPPTILGITRLRLSVGLNPSGVIGWTLRGFDWQRGGAATTIIFGETARPVLCYWEGKASGNTMDMASPPSGMTLASNGGRLELLNVTISGWGAAMPTPFLATFMGAVNCDLRNIPTDVTGFKLLSTRMGGGTVGLVAGQAMFVDGVSHDGPSGTSRTLSPGENQSSSRPGFARNYLGVIIASDSQNRTSFPADAGTFSYNEGFWAHHITIPTRTKAVRSNSFYDETTGTPRDHKFCGFYGSILPGIPCKGAPYLRHNHLVSEELSAPREAGWREFAYGIGQRGNLHQYVWDTVAASIDAPRHLGYGVNTPANNVFVDAVFVDDRTALTLGGAAGSYGGNYESAAVVPAYPRGARFDILGRALAPTLTRAGCFAGAP